MSHNTNYPVKQEKKKGARLMADLEAEDREYVPTLNQQLLDEKRLHKNTYFKLCNTQAANARLGRNYASKCKHASNLEADLKLLRAKFTEMEVDLDKVHKEKKEVVAELDAMKEEHNKGIDRLVKANGLIAVNKAINDKLKLVRPYLPPTKIHPSEGDHTAMQVVTGLMKRIRDAEPGSFFQTQLKLQGLKCWVEKWRCVTQRRETIHKMNMALAEAYEYDLQETHAFFRAEFRYRHRLLNAHHNDPECLEVLLAHQVEDCVGLIYFNNQHLIRDNMDREVRRQWVLMAHDKVWLRQVTFLVKEVFGGFKQAREFVQLWAMDNRCDMEHYLPCYTLGTAEEDFLGTAGNYDWNPLLWSVIDSA